MEVNTLDIEEMSLLQIGSIKWICYGVGPFAGFFWISLTIDVLKQ